MKEDACLPAGRHCILGVDFDNTLVDYDDVFWKATQRLGFVDSAVTPHKKNIRNAIRQLPDGEKKWQQVQAHVYGRAMGEARLIDGVQEFLQACRAARVPVYIVSHKTQFAAQDTDRINLRQATLNWMRQNGFFDPQGLGFESDQIFFESSRQDKVARIKHLNCTHFIDDLEETFLEKSFPPTTAKILYSPYFGSVQCGELVEPPGNTFSSDDMTILQDWREIYDHFFTWARP